MGDSAMEEEESKAAHLWEWEHDGPKTRAKLLIVQGGETVKEYHWSKWVTLPTPINFGYWK